MAHHKGQVPSRPVDLCGMASKARGMVTPWRRLSMQAIGTLGISGWVLNVGYIVSHCRREGVMIRCRTFSRRR